MFIFPLMVIQGLLQK